MKLKELIKEVKANKSQYCLTISMNTHRTAPDRKKDEIQLKNMMTEAEKMLNEKYEGDKKLITAIKTNLEKTVAKIDFSLNLDSIILMINEKDGFFATLPVAVEDRVSVCESFIIRNVVRAIYGNTHYYIFCLSLNEAQLLEAYNDSVADPYGEPFPLIFSPEVEKDFSTREKKLQENFLNDVDKKFQKAINQDKLPVVVCADNATYSQYLKYADKNNRFIGQFNMHYENTKNPNLLIAREAWKVVSQYNELKNIERINEIEKAINSGNFATDLSQILLKSKKGGVLYVKTGMFIPAIIENNLVTPVPDNRRGELGVVDDIVSEIILNVIEGDGEVVFIPGNALDKFNGLVLVD